MTGIDATQDLALVWEPGEGDFVEIVITRIRYKAVIGETDDYALLQCRVDDNGQYTIPAQQLAALPASYDREELIIRRVNRGIATASGTAVVLDIASGHWLDYDPLAEPCTPGEELCLGDRRAQCHAAGLWQIALCDSATEYCRECSDGSAACVPLTATQPCDATSFAPSCQGDVRLTGCLCDVTIEEPCSTGLSCQTCATSIPHPLFCTDMTTCNEWSFTPSCDGLFAAIDCACGQPVILDCVVEDPAPFGEQCCFDINSGNVSCSLYGNCN